MILELALALVLQQPAKAPTIVRIVQCVRLQADEPRTAKLRCESEDDALIIPDTYATLKGERFTIHQYSDGSEKFAERQPKGSVVYLAPPCGKPRPGYKRQALQTGPCNPGLPTR